MKQNILTNTKIHVKNEEESRKVQELAFIFGYKWVSSLDIISNLDVPYLFFYEDMNITHCNSNIHFDSHEHKLITFNELFPMEQKQKTKFTVLGQTEELKKELKPAVFVKSVMYGNNIDASNIPPDFKNVELITKNYITSGNVDYDLMFAYDDVREDGTAYLGHWNDGV